MKKVILISITLIFFGLAVNAQDVTESNVMSYVDKVEQGSDYDDYTEYYVRFKDGKSGYIYYDKENGKWYDTTPSYTFSIEIGNSRQKAIYWLWKDKH